MNKAKIIIIGLSDDYRTYLNEHAKESRRCGFPLESRPYIEKTMSGIFYAALDRAMWADWNEPGEDLPWNRLELIGRFCDLYDEVNNMQNNAGTFLHTPSYACMIIYKAVTGADLTDNEMRSVNSLDTAIQAYYDMARDLIVDDMYRSSEAPGLSKKD